MNSLLDVAKLNSIIKAIGSVTEKYFASSPKARECWNDFKTAEIAQNFGSKAGILKKILKKVSPEEEKIL